MCSFLALGSLSIVPGRATTQHLNERFRTLKQLSLIAGDYFWILWQPFLEAEAADFDPCNGNHSLSPAPPFLMLTATSNAEREVGFDNTFTIHKRLPNIVVSSYLGSLQCSYNIPAPPSIFATLALRISATTARSNEPRVPRKPDISTRHPLSLQT